MPNHMSDRLTRMRNARHLRGLEQGAFESNIESERNLASHLRAADKLSFQPAVNVAKGTFKDLQAGFFQLIGDTDTASLIRGSSRALSQAGREEAISVAETPGGIFTAPTESIVGAAQTMENVGKSALRSASLSAAGGGGATGLITGSGLVTGAEQFTTQKLAGKTTKQALASGATSGIIEAGITALFQRGGLGGIENAAIKTQLANTMRNSLTNVAKETGKQFGAELLEEASIAEIDKIAQSFIAGKGVQDLQDPEFWAEMEEELTQVLIETGITGGLAEGLRAPSRVRASKQQRQDKVDSDKQQRQAFADLVEVEKGKREDADLRAIQDNAVELAEAGVLKAEKVFEDIAKREERRAEVQSFEQKEEALDSVRAQNAELRGEIDQQVQDKAAKRQELLADIAAEAAVDTAIAQGMQELQQRRDDERINRQAILQDPDFQVAKREVVNTAEVMETFFPDEKAELREAVEGIQTVEDAIALDELMQQKIQDIPDEHAEAKAALQVRVNDARAQGQLEGEAHLLALQQQEEIAEEQDLEQGLATEQAFEAGREAAAAELLPPKKRKPRAKKQKGPIKRPVAQEFEGPEFRPAEEAAPQVDEFSELRDLVETEPAARKTKAVTKKRKAARERAVKKPVVAPTERKPLTAPQQAKLEDLKPEGITDEQLATEVTKIETLAREHFGADVDIETKKNHVLVTLPNGRRIGIFVMTQQEAARELAKSPDQSFASMKAKGIDPGVTVKKWRGMSEDQRTQVLLDKGISTLAAVIPNPTATDIVMDIDSAIFLTDGRATLSTLQEEATHDAFIGLMTDEQLDTINTELIRLGRLKKGGNGLRNDADFIEEGFELYRDWLNEQPTGLSAKVKKIFRSIFKFSNKLNDVFESLRSGEIGFQEQVAPTTTDEQRRAAVLEGRRPAPDVEGGSLVTETVVARVREEKQRAEKKVSKITRAEQEKIGTELLEEKGESEVIKGIREKLRTNQPLDLSEQRALSSLIKKQGRKLDDIAQQEDPDAFFREDATLIDLLRLREQQGSLIGRGLEAFKDGTPVDKKAFILGRVFSLTNKEQTQVTNLEKENQQSKADALTKTFQKAHYKKFVKFMKDMGFDLKDITSENLESAEFFSVAGDAAESAKTGRKAFGLVNVFPAALVLGFGTIGKVGFANAIGTAMNITELGAKGLLNFMTGNNIKSLPTGGEAAQGIYNFVANIFAGYKFAPDAFANAGTPAFDAMRGIETLGQSELERSQGFRDDVERVLPASDKRLHIRILRKIFQGITLPGRSMGSIDQLSIAPLISMYRATIPQQEARALGLKGQDLEDFLRFVEDPAAIAQEGIRLGLEEKVLDEYVKKWRDLVGPVHDEIEAEIRKMTASLGFDEKTAAGFVAKKLEQLKNVELAETGIRPLLSIAPVFRGPLRGAEFAARRAPIVSIIASVNDYFQFRADPTNARKRQAASQAVVTIMAHTIFPAIVAGLLSDEGEEELAKGKIWGYNLTRVPLLGDAVAAYGEYVQLLSEGAVEQANAAIGRAFEMFLNATPARSVARTVFAEEPAEQALKEATSTFLERDGGLREPAMLRDVKGQVTGEKEIKELFGVRSTK